jgi:hypothetical protein
MTAVDSAPMNEIDAHRITARITLVLGALTENLDKVSGLIREAERGQAHVALGYQSWTAYVAREFGGMLPKLDRDVRREFVGQLAESGMSTRAIAPIVGADYSTVSRDIQAGVADATPERAFAPAAGGAGEVAESAPATDDPASPEDEVVDAEIVEDDPEPRKITGRDGKTYTAPSAQPRRKPLTDVARNAGWELSKAVERLERLAADDRFTSNKDQMAPHLRSHLTNAIEVCQDLLDRIS